MRPWVTTGTLRTWNLVTSIRHEEEIARRKAAVGIGEHCICGTEISHAMPLVCALTCAVMRAWKPWPERSATPERTAATAPAAAMSTKAQATAIPMWPLPMVSANLFVILLSYEVSHHSINFPCTGLVQGLARRKEKWRKSHSSRMVQVTKSTGSKHVQPVKERTSWRVTM